MEPVQDDELQMEAPQLERPGADVITLPQLERLPPHPDRQKPATDSPSVEALDGRPSRHESLELVRAAVELADRIERDVQESAKERLARIDEEVRRRRLGIDDQERELERTRQDLELAREDLARARHDVERARQQAIDAAQEAQALRASAELEATDKIALASAQAEAILDHAHREAEEIAQAARREAEQTLAEARAEADATRTLTPQHEPETTLEPEPEFEPEPKPEAEERPDDEPVADEPADVSPPAVDPEPVSFRPPPLSLEDLAAISSIPHLGTTLGRFRRR